MDAGCTRPSLVVDEKGVFSSWIVESRLGSKYGVDEGMVVVVLLGGGFRMVVLGGNGVGCEG